MSYKELLDKINEEVEKGAETFDELSPELRNEIDKSVPPEIVYKGEGKEQIEDIKYYIGLF